MAQSEFEILFDDAEARLERLKARYEQWFQGVERLPPVRFREQLERILREMRRRPPNNTMLRFKFQTLFQRWTTMTTYWDRITRQIEEGTYRRDVMKVRRRRAKREAREEMRDVQGPDASSPMDDGIALELDLDSVDFDLDAEVDAAMSALTERETAARSFSKPTAAKPPVATPHVPHAPTPRVPTSPKPATFAKPTPAAPKAAVFGKPAAGRPSSRPPAMQPAGRPIPLPLERPPPAPPPRRPPIRPEAARAAARLEAPMKPPPRPAASPAQGLSRDEMRAVYERYVAARKQNNERVDNVKYEKLAASIEKMVPKLQQKHQGKKIDFEVVVRDGRVGLKPIAKK